ncbi:conserved domain protein [Actinomyces sp. oral taxon 170 str. F0386]|nr:conserved domain protein [Actinomyces sp. oral taxon 170 str. F0386]
MPLSGLDSGVVPAETSVQARLQLQARNPVDRDTTATSAMMMAPRRGLRPLRSRLSI